MSGAPRAALARPSGLLYRMRTGWRVFRGARGSDAAAASTETASRPLGPAGYLAIAAATAVIGWGALVSLPYDRYERFQLLRSTDYIKGQWIYERLTFDATPVDVAFFGTSHTLAGVDGALVERVANAGAAAPIHVANLSLPHYGRDLDFLLTRLATETKHPRLLIIEADYIEFRVPHPAFPLVAETRDVLDAPVVVNPGFVDNLMWLAKRELQILEARLFSDGTDPARFDAAHYAGPHWDDTYRTTARGGFVTPPRTTHPDPAVLRREAGREARDEQAKARGYERTGWLELHYHHVFLERLAEQARRSGTRIVFLYLPTFSAPALPSDAALLRRYGDIWTPPERILGDPNLWYDKSHLNYYGAQALSQWLGEQLAANLQTSASAEQTSAGAE